MAWIGLAALIGCASSQSPERVTEGQKTVGTSEEMTRMIGGSDYLDFRSETEHRVTSHNIGAGADTVWAVLPGVLNDLGIPIGVLLSDRREVGVVNHRARRALGELPLSRVLDCGGPMGVPNADSYNVTLTVVTRVVPQTSATSTLQTQIEATAMPSGVSSNPVRCTTKGLLENQIAQKVRERTLY